MKSSFDSFVTYRHRIVKQLPTNKTCKSGPGHPPAGGWHDCQAPPVEVGSLSQYLPLFVHPSMVLMFFSDKCFEMYMALCFMKLSVCWCIFGMDLGWLHPKVEYGNMVRFLGRKDHGPHFCLPWFWRHPSMPCQAAKHHSPAMFWRSIIVLLTWIVLATYITTTIHENDQCLTLIFLDSDHFQWNSRWQNIRSGVLIAGIQFHGIFALFWPVIYCRYVWYMLII